MIKTKNNFQKLKTMKKLLLVCIAIFAVSSVFGQRGKVTAAAAFIDNGDLSAAKQRIDEALLDPVSKEWPKTYIVGARLAAEEYKKNKDKEEILKAGDYYLKAIELDQKGDAKGKGIGKFANEIKMNISLFVPNLQNAGIEAFNAEDFSFSMKVFERVAALNGSSIFQVAGKPAVVDSVFIYYTALSGLRSSNWAKAEEYFNKSIELKYGQGDPVLLLHEVYTSSGDSSKICQNLKTGIELFPQDDRIMMQLINYYLSTKQNEEALEYLNSAIEKDSQNYSYYFVRGFLFENNKDFEKAETEYLKAIEIKPDYYEPLISLGVIYFNRGAEQTRIAQDITDFKKYEAAMAESLKHFEQSLPYVERADSAKPNEEHVLETLKSLYYRLEMMDKYNEINERIESLKKE